MVHGKCKSAGCYAMTDALIEEIYTLARESLKGGQESFEVHAFPFRMTEANMARYQGNTNVPFWKTLKQGYDFFEKYRLPPTVAVCEQRYVVNVKMPIQRLVARPTAAARASSARCSSRSRPSPTSSRSPRSASWRRDRRRVSSPT